MSGEWVTQKATEKFCGCYEITVTVTSSDEVNMTFHGIGEGELLEMDLVCKITGPNECYLTEVDEETGEVTGKFFLYFLLILPTRSKIFISKAVHGIASSFYSVKGQ